MNLADEKWETIKDFPNYMISTESRIINKTTLNMVSISINKKHKHRAVRLWQNGKTRLLKVYRLKAQAFIPNPDNKPQVNHKDGNRMNEDLSNLEWVTASENMKHSFQSGLCRGFYKKGLENQNRKINVEDILLLRRWYQSGFFDSSKLSKVFGCNSSYLAKIARGSEAKYV
jgi:hypothetical protein